MVPRFSSPRQIFPPAASRPSGGHAGAARADELAALTRAEFGHAKVVQLDVLWHYCEDFVAQLVDTAGATAF